MKEIREDDLGDEESQRLVASALRRAEAFHNSHATPDFYRSHGYCEQSCRTCDGLDAIDKELGRRYRY